MTELEEPILGWRTLKEIYHHYLLQTPSEEGISAAEAIERAEKGTRVREVAVEVLTAKGSMRPEQAATVLASVKNDKDQAERMRAIALHVMVRDAAAGLWFAIGRPNGVGKHQFIHPSDWKFLFTNIEKGAIGRDGVRFEDLRCAFTKDVPEGHPIRTAIRNAREDSPPVASVDSAVISAQEIVSPPTAPFGRQNDSHHDGPGRPSTFHLIDGEFEQRMERNLLESSLSKEALVLSAWFRTAHPHCQPYQPKTIANRLRARYRAAKAVLKKRPKL